MKANGTLFNFLVIVFFLTATAINAQVRIGIKGEVGANKITLDNEMLKESNYNTYKVGPAIEFMIPFTDFGVEGAILYSNDRTTIKKWEEQSLNAYKGEVHYLDIPINLKYKISLSDLINIYLSGGPYAHFKLDENDFFEKFKEDIQSKTFAAGLNFGAGIELFDNLSVGAGYTIKLTDDYSSQKPEWLEAFNHKRGVWSLTAAIYF